MEFRLSENTVSDYDTYCTERDKYKSGANPGGGWLPLKDYMVAQGFTTTWCWGGPAQGTKPTKNGSTALWDDCCAQVANLPGYDASMKFVIGFHGAGDDKVWSGQGGNNTDGDGLAYVYFYMGNAAKFNDYPVANLKLLPMLIFFVRPL